MNRAAGIQVGCGHDRVRRLQYGFPITQRQRLKAVPEVQELEKGVVVEPAAAAAVFTAPAVKPGRGRRLRIGRIHIGEQSLQPPQKGRAIGGLHQLTFWVNGDGKKRLA